MHRLAIATCSILLAAGRVHAQSSDNTALAEQLFNQGRELAKRNDWAAACPKFEASFRYDPTLGTRLNLATCNEKLHKLASAWAHYRGAAEVAGKMGDTQRRDYALQHAAALEPRLPRLTIAPPAHVPDNLSVTRDNVALDVAVLGTPLYVDPGVHEIRATAPGGQPFTISITLRESESQTVTIPELARKLPPTPELPRPARPLPPRAEPPRAEPQPPRAEPPRIEPPGAVPPRTEQPAPPEPPERAVHPLTEAPASRTRKRVGIGIAAAGGVAIGAGLVFGVKARSTNSEVRTLCGADLACDAPDFDRGHHLVEDARSQALTATVLVAAGTAAVVTGAIVWLTAPAERPGPVARLVPILDRGDKVGLAITGRF